MSMRAMEIKCSKCGKKYSFNPSVGKGLMCPKCGKTSADEKPYPILDESGSILGKIFGNK